MNRQPQCPYRPGSVPPAVEVEVHAQQKRQVGVVRLIGGGLGQGVHVRRLGRLLVSLISVGVFLVGEVRVAEPDEPPPADFATSRP